jgi:hypothetical protein
MLTQTSPWIYSDKTKCSHSLSIISPNSISILFCHPHIHLRVLFGSDFPTVQAFLMVLMRATCPVLALLFITLIVFGTHHEALQYALISIVELLPVS